MSKSNAVKSVSTVSTPAVKGSTFATLQAASASVSASPAAPVKAVAVAVVAGLINGAPANAPAFVCGGVPYTGNLPPHIANKQGVGNVGKMPVGSVTITAKGALLTPGGVAYNALAWVAINKALSKGACTAAQLAQAVGNGGAAHIGYRIKGGWLAVTK